MALPLAAILLVTAFNPSHFTGRPCLTEGFYGTYGSNSVFVLDSECILSLPADFLSASVVEPHHHKDQRLVWVEEVSVDDTLTSGGQAFSTQLDGLLTQWSTSSFVDVHSPQHQHVFSPSPDTTVQSLYRTNRSALISMSHDTSRVIDTQLPKLWKSFLLPMSPIVLRPVPRKAIEHIRYLLSTLKFDPVVAAITNNMSVPQMLSDLQFLTGEDGKSGIVSRHSFAEGSRTAAAWLKERIEATGASCDIDYFLPGFSPNIICRYQSVVNTTSTIMLGAHYDSRGSFGSMRAPGADDNGSGTVSLLAIARTIGRKGLSFRSNVELVAFSGEEQGLLGSRAYAGRLHARNANLTLMIQADMLAYRVPGEPPQLGLPVAIGTPEVGQLLANISAIYSPELRVGFTSVCCSDHQSFHERGFPATHVFERAGPIADPMYHNSGDLSNREGYDLQQLKAIAVVQFATLLHAAGFDLPG